MNKKELQKELREDFLRQLQENSAGTFNVYGEEIDEMRYPITINDNFLKKHFDEYFIYPDRDLSEKEKVDYAEDCKKSLEGILEQISKNKKDLFSICESKLNPFLSKWSDEEKQQFKERSYYNLDLPDDKSFFDIFRCYAAWKYDLSGDSLHIFIDKQDKELKAIVAINEILKENLSFAEHCYLFMLVGEYWQDYKTHSDFDVENKKSNEFILCWLMTKWSEFIENSFDIEHSEIGAHWAFKEIY